MTEHRPRVAGLPLHRLVLSPESEPRGGLLFFHGQGDFIDRYAPVLEGFVKAGYECVLTDFPGHGRSPGRRGEVPGLDFVDALFEDSLAHLRGLPGPALIAGHSMGGLMALRYLLRSPEHFAAGWISSPLLDPMGQAAPWMRVALPVLSEILPWVTVTTGVRSEDCGDGQDERKTGEKGALYHSRISIGWGRDLRDAAELVRGQFPTLPTKKPLLFTQGDLDVVCPPQLLADRLGKLPPNQVTFEKIAGARHEPFIGSTEEEFLRRLNRWIEATVGDLEAR